MITTAERLKAALELRNMKAIDLHNRTKINKSSISQYISGTVKPKQDRIYLLAQALNVDELWLMGHDVPMERQAPASVLPTRDAAMLAAYHAAPPNVQQVVDLSLQPYMPKTEEEAI